MSFGCSVGDCIALLQLANKVHERFNDAPKQFKAISGEVTSLSNVLRVIERELSRQEFANWQRELAFILQGCRDALIAAEKLVDKNSDLNLSNSHGILIKPRRVWKRLTWKPTDIQELRSRIALNVNLLNAFNGSLISNGTLDNRDELQRLHERHDKRERQEEDQNILDWLTSMNYASQQHDFISRRQPGTGQWLLDSVEFQAWRNAGKQTLFCPGIPGAGKTIITSIVVEDLYSRFQDDSSIGIAYLYCNFNRSHEQKLDDLLLSLLKQLAQEQLSIPGAVKLLYKRHNNRPKSQKTRPSIGEISDALRSIISGFSRVFIIIDALDECQVNDRCRSMLLSELLNIQTSCGVNLFATSRFIPEVIDQFKSAPQLEIRASDDDLRMYLDGEMARLRMRNCVSNNPELQERIKNVIVRTVDGMFLLAQLHLHSLKDIFTTKSMKYALEKLPKELSTLDLAYEGAIRRIKTQEPGCVEMAWRVLTWIACAKRPLSSIELQHALATETDDSELDVDNFPDIEEIASLCAGLVTVDRESNIVRLIHYTTQEYFEQRQNSLFPDAQVDIAVVCITYLSFDTFETGACPTDDEFKTRVHLYPLYKYAARNWGYHARSAPTELELLILKFLKNEHKVLAAGQALMDSLPGLISRRKSVQLTEVHLAALFDLDGVILSLIENGNHPDLKDDCGQTPLSWAAENGHDAVVELLLEKGADIESKDIYCQPPLLWAMRNGHKTTVNLLLEKGAKLDFKDDHGRTLLSWAARKGHKAFVSLMLEKGAELESKDDENQTPLFWASRNGHQAVVMLLLEKGAEFECKDNKGRTPFSWAAGNGHEEVVNLLAGKGAELDSKDDYGQTLLSWAARYGYEEIVKLLLAKGAKVESKDNKGRIPLTWAVGRKHTAVERLLLEKGAKKINI